MDTIKEGRFEDTNKLFQNPDKVDFHLIEWNDHNHDDVAKEILQGAKYKGVDTSQRQLRGETLGKRLQPKSHG